MLQELVRAVVSCTGDSEKYNALGRFFIDFWIRLELEHYPEQSHRAAKKNALIRDDFRCVLTGHYDWTSFEQIEEIRQKVELEQVPIVPTRCTHVTCESTNLDIKKNQRKQLKYPTAAWAVLEIFGYQDLFDELHGKGIHRLENIVTLSGTYHNLFDQLRLWLEAMDAGQDTHKYKVCATEPLVPEQGAFRVYRVYQFNSFHGISFPNAFKTVSGSTCGLLQSSQYLNNIEIELESGTVLAEDGGSAYLLEQCLENVYAGLETA
ncbi:hypothetical protein C8J56DRAFT_1114240 [Mycena floridula]|nr:hypothetical protein C8J56DRAFT_1114240 [Mycena floridula]